MSSSSEIYNSNWKLANLRSDFSAWFVSVTCREIVNFDDVVVLLVLRLSVRQRNYEEFRFNLFNTFALCQDGWHHVVWAWFSHLEQFSVVRVSENSVALKCLALIRHHVAFNSDVFTFWLHHHCYKLGHLKPIGVFENVLLLQ
jgi:hypothetical protein